jgi:tRNA(adenine34) deaminase
MKGDLDWIGRALLLASVAEASGEVPVGAVVVRDGETLGEGWNSPISTSDPTAHAEIVALRAAGQKVGNYRLTGATLYVSLEPCLMCMGAMIHARIKRLVFGAHEPKTGASRMLPVLTPSQVNHTFEILGGVREAECAEILRTFFDVRRNN